jgi:hypothetical protein
MGTVQRYNTETGQHAAVLTHYGSVAEIERDCVHTADSAFTLRAANEHRLAELEVPQGGIRWYGVPSLADVKHILREGYPEGAALVEQLYEAIAPKLPRAIDYRRQRVRSDQGASLDIHAVNRGALDKAWETTKRRAQAGTGLIRIAVDICGNGYVSAEQLRWRGIAALALSRAMTKSGYSVEIVAGQSGKNAYVSKPDLVGTITVTVKPRHAVVDTATLAATVCMPGFFRYLGFASIIRQADDIGVDVINGLGRAVRLESVLPVPMKISQVVAHEGINSQAEAEQWVRESVALLQGATITKERN